MAGGVGVVSGERVGVVCLGGVGVVLRVGSFWGAVSSLPVRKERGDHIT